MSWSKSNCDTGIGFQSGQLLFSLLQPCSLEILCVHQASKKQVKILWLIKFTVSIYLMFICTAIIKSSTWRPFRSCDRWAHGKVNNLRLSMLTLFWWVCFMILFLSFWVHIFLSPPFRCRDATIPLSRFRAFLSSCICSSYFYHTIVVPYFPKYTPIIPPVPKQLLKLTNIRLEIDILFELYIKKLHKKITEIRDTCAKCFMSILGSFPLQSHITNKKLAGWIAFTDNIHLKRWTFLLLHFSKNTKFCCFCKKCIFINH